MQNLLLLYGFNGLSPTSLYVSFLPVTIISWHWDLKTQRPMLSNNTISLSLCFANYNFNLALQIWQYNTKHKTNHGNFKKIIKKKWYPRNLLFSSFLFRIIFNLTTRILNLFIGNLWLINWIFKFFHKSWKVHSNM